MTETIFFRILQADDKTEALHDAVSGLRDGTPSDVFAVDPVTFGQIPGSPFAYWVSESVRRLFEELPSFEGRGRTAKQGLATADDFRFIRASWEVSPSRVLDGSDGPYRLINDFQQWCRQRTSDGARWVNFAKGGKFSPYHCDLHLVIDWKDSGKNIASFPGAVIRNPGYYFRPGLTWPLRARRFSPQALQAGSIFSARGYAAFPGDDSVASLCAFTNSSAFDYLFKVMLGRFEYPEFVVGVLQQLPKPDFGPSHHEVLASHGKACIEARRSIESPSETSHAFTTPALIQAQQPTLGEAISRRNEIVRETDEMLARNQAEIDDIAFKLYGISDEDRQAIESGSSSGGDETVEDDESDADEDEDETEVVDPVALVDSLISYAVGCAFGRWDARIALDPTLAPELQGPFEPLPVCSPGMLVGTDGLPARPNGIASEVWMQTRPNAITLPEPGSVEPPTIPDSQYPLRIDWDGIMVDDQGHPDDVVSRVRDLLHLLWKERADSIEREACEILGVSDLRDYVRNPRRFWDAHVKRYSKSRRKAPIYWLLQSAKRGYSIWLYYHRMDADILFKALRNYVDPKLALERNRLDEQRSRLLAAVEAGGRVRRDAERAVERQEALIEEIEQFRKTLERVAHLGLTVDHDDGVLLSIAPLHELVPWKPAEQAWKDLVAGKYEWSTMSRQMREKGLVRGGRR